MVAIFIILRERKRKNKKITKISIMKRLKKLGFFNQKQYFSMK
jgi:hypothetical protein